MLIESAHHSSLFGVSCFMLPSPIKVNSFTTHMDPHLTNINWSNGLSIAAIHQVV